MMKLNIGSHSSLFKKMRRGFFEKPTMYQSNSHREGSVHIFIRTAAFLYIFKSINSVAYFVFRLFDLHQRRSPQYDLESFDFHGQTSKQTETASQQSVFDFDLWVRTPKIIPKDLIFLKYSDINDFSRNAMLIFLNGEEAPHFLLPPNVSLPNV